MPAKPKRMPTKGTPEYREYWRNRHMLDELKLVRGHLEFVVRDSESGRRTAFDLSLRFLDEAINTFDLGHQFSYTD